MDHGGKGCLSKVAHRAFTRDAILFFGWKSCIFDAERPYPLLADLPKGLARCRTPLGSVKMSAQLTLRPTVG